MPGSRCELPGESIRNEDASTQISGFAAKRAHHCPVAKGRQSIRSVATTIFRERCREITSRKWENRKLDRAKQVLIAGVRNNHLLTPIFEVPPRWAQFTRPLLGNAWAKPRLVLDRGAEIEKAVSDALSAGQMDRVVDAISWLEGARFKIDQPVHEFIFRWQKKKRPVYWKGKSKNRFRQPTWFMDWMTSAHLQCREWFCVPLHMEFPGRIYGIPHFNFLREDHVRALFLFKNGLPIGIEGLKWLKYHVAGCADGISWDTRKLGNLNLDERVLPRLYCAS
jgi:DNA-directed RNA polymerase